MSSVPRIPYFLLSATRDTHSENTNFVVVDGWLQVPESIASSPLGYIHVLRRLSIDQHKYFEQEKHPEKEITVDKATEDWNMKYRPTFERNVKDRREKIERYIAGKEGGLSALTKEEAVGLVFSDGLVLLNN